MSDSDKQEGPRTPAASFIQKQRQGGLHGELTDALADLTQDVLAIGKKGTLTLTLTLVPTGDGVTLAITDKIVVKSPEPEKGASIFFGDEHGNLLRNDPRQMRLDQPLRDASEAKA